MLEKRGLILKILILVWTLMLLKVSLKCFLGFIETEVLEEIVYETVEDAIVMMVRKLFVLMFRKMVLMMKRLWIRPVLCFVSEITRIPLPAMMVDPTAPMPERSVKAGCYQRFCLLQQQR